MPRTIASRTRLIQLMVAGLVDSLCLSLAWTVVILRVVEQYGLVSVGILSAAMLVGVALSAPVASRVACWLDGRHLLRSAALVEAVLRLSVFALLLGNAPVPLLAACVVAMNVTAWTGYAGMRAEVAAVTTGAGGLTWYGTGVAAVEAVGAAVAAVLPVGRSGAGGVMVGVIVCYVLALVPTYVVAGGSPVGRSTRPHHLPKRTTARTFAPMAAGAVLMLMASGPTLLSVALAAHFHGREAVVVTAAAFTLGSLFAPTAAGWMQRLPFTESTIWLLCGVGMVAGWALAPVSVAWLCLAQVSSGLFMTALEGLLDSAAARRQPTAVTGALARVTAARALGSAGGTAILPRLMSGVGLPAVTGACAAGLLSVAGVITLTRLIRRPTAAAHLPAREPAPAVDRPLTPLAELSSPGVVQPPRPRSPLPRPPRPRSADASGVGRSAADRTGR